MNPIKWMASLSKNGPNTTAERRQPAAAPKSCELQGKVYPHGAEVRQGTLIRQCLDGQWQEQVNPFITVGP